MPLRDDVSLADLVRATYRLAEKGDRITHLGICPMSEELIRTPIELALEYGFPALFVASRNQVSEDEGGGYLMGLTPESFVQKIIDMENSLGINSDSSPDYMRFISVDHCGPWYKEREKKLFSYIKRVAPGQVYIFFHTCGSVYDLIPDLIEAGIDILNPVQVSAAKMDTARLKKEFGKELTFWGGGIDTQYVLPHGTVQQVKDEVKRRVDDLAPGGGFIFGTVHNIQNDVPPENIMTMWETLQEYGVY